MEKSVRRRDARRDYSRAYEVAKSRLHGESRTAPTARNSLPFLHFSNTSLEHGVHGPRSPRRRRARSRTPRGVFGHEIRPEASFRAAGRRTDYRGPSPVSLAEDDYDGGDVHAEEALRGDNVSRTSDIVTIPFGARSVMLSSYEDVLYICI